MYIPVSLAQGAASVTCTVNATGNLVAQCQAVYAGTTYAPGATVAVVKNTTIKFDVLVTAYAEISVVLAGKQFYWYVDLPKSLRYVTDSAFKRVTGSVPGKLYHYPSGTGVPFTEAGPFVSSDAVAAVDFVKKAVWFFNAAGNVKKVTVATAPVAAVFAPRWALADGVATVPFIVADGKITRLTTTFDTDVTFDIEAGCTAASGDVTGNIVLAYPAKLVVWNPTTGAIVETISTDQGFAGLYGVFVFPDNSYVTVGTAGVKLSIKNAGVWTTTTILANTGRVQSFDLSTTHLYVTDGTNRCMYAIRLTDWSNVVENYDTVPRSVVVKDTTVTVGFYNSTTSYRYALDLTGKTTLTTVKTYGAAYLNDYVVTDLYSDAADVTLAEPDVAPLLIQPADFPVSAVMHYEWKCTWARPDFVRVGATNAVVKVNGQVFTSGYLKLNDLMTIDVPATEDYYYDRWVSLVGRRCVTFGFRSEPKLFPDLVTLPRILDALPRIVYDFDYYVTGLTDGFSVPIHSEDDEVEVKFSINDGAFGYAGTITNGDHIQVQAVLQNLRAKLTPHVVRTVPAQVDVFSLTVLPMILSGVEIRRTKEGKLPRYGNFVRENKPVTMTPGVASLLRNASIVSEDQQPEIMWAATLVSAPQDSEMLYAATLVSAPQVPELLYAATLIGAAQESEMLYAATQIGAPQLPVVQHHRGTSSLQALSDAARISVTFSTQISEDVIRVQHNVGDWYAQFDASVFPTHVEVHQRELPERDVPRIIAHQLELPERDVPRIITHQRELPERDVPRIITHQLEQPEWIFRPVFKIGGRTSEDYHGSTRFTDDANWEKWINVARMWSPETPTEWILTSLNIPRYLISGAIFVPATTTQKTDAVYEYLRHRNSSPVAITIRFHTLQHLEEFETGHARVPATTTQKTDAIYGLTYASHRERSDTEFRLRNPWHREVIQWTHERRMNASHIMDVENERAVWTSRLMAAAYQTNGKEHRFVLAAYEHKPTVASLPFDAVSEFRGGGSRSAMQVNNVQRPAPTRILINRPTFAFAVRDRDFVLPEVMSNIGDFPAATEYAESLELTNVVPLQVGSKWVFVTTPIANSALCGIVPLPPAKQKLFGYVGGG